MHLKTYRTSNYNKNVLHQVILNEDFTRSVIYSLNRLARYVEDIISENRSVKNDELTRIFGRMHSDIKYIDMEKLDGKELSECLHNLKTEMQNFNKQLTASFFSYV